MTYLLLFFLEKTSFDRSTAKELGIPFLCGIPIDIKLRECADEGQPAVNNKTITAGSQAIINLAKDVTAHLEKN